MARQLRMSIPFLPPCVLLLVMMTACGATGSHLAHGEPGKVEPHPHAKHARLRATVSGVAARYVGPPVASQRAVRVNVIRMAQGGKLVTRATARQRNGGHYRLRLAPGTYVIRALGSHDPARRVTLAPGQAVRLDFPDYCF